MKRKSWSRLGGVVKAARRAVAALAFGGVAMWGCSRLQAAERQYNFVVILADDLSDLDLACYGNKQNPTPNLDRLASEGMQFTMCYGTPICSPSRVQILTGQYGFRTGWMNLMGRPYTPQKGTVRRDIGLLPTFADVLKQAGYATALAGKWQLPGEIPNLIHECGFDTYRMWAYRYNLPPGVVHTGRSENQTALARFWHPGIMQDGQYMPTQPTDYGPDLFQQFLVDFIRQNKDRPFCAYYSSVLTHTPWEATPDPDHPGEKRPDGFRTNLEYLDHQVGQITRTIDELGLRDNTIILFVGDNCSAHMSKGNLNEMAVRVPLIVRCPGTVKAGVVSKELTDLSDVLPTLADFAGAPLPADRIIDGVSLAPTLRGGENEHRPWIFSFLARGRILRDQRFLLVDPGEPGEAVQFFDCGASRNQLDYRDVTDSGDAEIVAARARFDQILSGLPRPNDDPDLIPPKLKAPAASTQPSGSE